jgi:hydrogenase maturation factor
MATIDVEGVQREASLLLLEDARVGDYVIVHAGFALPSQNSMKRRRRRPSTCCARRSPR